MFSSDGPWRLQDSFLRDKCPVCSAKLDAQHQFAYLGSGASVGFPETGEYVQLVKARDWARVNDPFLRLSEDDALFTYVVRCERGYGLVVGAEIYALHCWVWRPVLVESISQDELRRLESLVALEWLPFLGD